MISLYLSGKKLTIKPSKHGRSSRDQQEGGGDFRTQGICWVFCLLFKADITKASPFASSPGGGTYISCSFSLVALKIKSRHSERGWMARVKPGLDFYQSPSQLYRPVFQIKARQQINTFHFLLGGSSSPRTELSTILAFRESDRKPQFSEFANLQFLN